MIEDRTYPVTPPSMTVKSGIITGEVVDLKVTERVEKGSERIVSPARLTGTLRLENTSANRTVRLVEGKLLFMDVHGQVIKLEGDRAEPIVRFTPYGDERLDPGQDTTQVLDVEFPGGGLEGGAAEGDPPGAGLHPVPVPRGGRQLRGIDRRGSVGRRITE